MNQQQLHEENREMSRALYEELAALKIRIAFAEISAAELDEYDRELSSVCESDYSQAAQQRALKLIERRLNRRLRRRFIKHTLPYALQIAAASLLLFFIGLTTAVATVRPVRLKLMDFIALIDKNYSSISIDYNDNENAAPQMWRGGYYPYYIPDGFVLARIDDIFNIAYYTAAEDRILQFSEFENADYSNVDIDEEAAFDITVNEDAGIAMTDETHTAIAWCIDDTYLCLYFSGDLETALQIANSVRRVN